MTMPWGTASLLQAEDSNTIPILESGKNICCSTPSMERSSRRSSSRHTLVPPVPPRFNNLTGAASCLSEWTTDDEETQQQPLPPTNDDVWDATGAPRTAPRAPKKAVSSASRRKAQPMTLQRDMYFGDEEESLSQRTFDRLTSLQLEEAHPFLQQDESSRPVLQSAFADLTLLSSPTSKQLTFCDDDDADDEYFPPRRSMDHPNPATSSSAHHYGTTARSMGRRRRRDSPVGPRGSPVRFTVCFPVPHRAGHDGFPHVMLEPTEARPFHRRRTELPG